MFINDHYKFRPSFWSLSGGTILTNISKCELSLFLYKAGCFRLRLSLQPPADFSSPLADFSTLKMETIRSSETTADAISTQRYIPEDDILRSHRCENLKSYMQTIYLTYGSIFALFASTICAGLLLYNIKCKIYIK
jgi:hypothetical protein